jgi:hypothetical protein
VVRNRRAEGHIAMLRGAISDLIANLLSHRVENRQLRFIQSVSAVRLIATALATSSDVENRQVQTQRFSCQFL